MTNIELYPLPTESLVDEDPFRLAEGPRRVSMSKSKLYQLIREGKVNHRGERIHLEWCAIESGIWTSKAAVKRFRHRLSE